MNTIDFSQLRRRLDEAITYAQLDTAWDLAIAGLDAAERMEELGEMMYFQAQCQIIDANFEAAIEFLNRAIAFNPSDGAAFNDRALCRLEAGADQRDVLADFDQGIAVEPDYETIYHNKGWYLNRIGRHHEAIACFQKALCIEPNRAVTYENLADTYVNLDDIPQALRALKQALRCLPPGQEDIREQLQRRVNDLTGDFPNTTKGA